LVAAMAVAFGALKRDQTIVRPSAVACNCNYTMRKPGAYVFCGCVSAGHENYAKQWRLNARDRSTKSELRWL